MTVRLAVDNNILPPGKDWLSELDVSTVFLSKDRRTGAINQIEILAISPNRQVYKLLDILVDKCTWYLSTMYSKDNVLLDIL